MSNLRQREPSARGERKASGPSSREAPEEVDTVRGRVRFVSFKVGKSGSAIVNATPGLPDLPAQHTTMVLLQFHRRRVANMAGVNMAGRKDVVGSQSRRSGLRNLVAKHQPFPFILPR